MRNLPGSLRKDQILQGALQFVRDRGFQEITCQALADKVGVSYNTVRRHLGNRVDIMREVTRYAAKVDDSAVLETGKRLGFDK